MNEQSMAISEVEAELGRAAIFAEAVPDSVVIRLTETMIAKSIIDASAPTREVLERTGIHNFSLQEQGIGAKCLLPLVLVNPARQGATVKETKVSLYRPQTKEGDPRLWIYGIPTVAQAGDLVALGVGAGGRLIAANLSSAIGPEGDLSLVEALADFGLAEPGDVNPSLERLVSALRGLAVSGPIRAVTSGDTAVGATMEAALGIPINSSKLPDWEGRIELKFSRPRPTQRKNLFAQVPDWEHSPIKSSKGLLEAFGYMRDGKRRLYCTVASGRANSQGIYLSTQQDIGWVSQLSMSPEWPLAVVWELALLEERLATKHRETCWVICDTSLIGGVEHFSPVEVLYTSRPRVDLLGQMIEAGDVTVDYLIKEIASGAAKDKGYLWKVSSAGHSLLLPNSRPIEFR